MSGTGRVVLVLGCVACSRGPAELEEHCGEVTSNDTWRYGTHVVTCDVVVRAAHLAIDSDVDVTFAPGTSIEVEEGGSLEIAGTAAHPVVLHGQTDTPAAWEGVFLYEGSDGKRNRIANTTLRNAGQYANRYRAAGLHVRGTELAAENLELADNAGMGFVLADGGMFADGTTGLSVHGNEDGPVEAHGASAGTIPLGSELTGNIEQDMIEVLGVVDRSTSWPAHDGVPYFVADTIDVQGDDAVAVLTLLPGVHLRFAEDELLRVGYSGPGALVADGAGGDRIVFTSAGTEIPGTWGGVALEENTVSETTRLINFEIAWGGSYEAALYVRQCSPHIDRGYIHDNVGCGVYVSGSDAEPLMGSVTYSNNSGGGFCQQ